MAAEHYSTGGDVISRRVDVIDLNIVVVQLKLDGVVGIPLALEKGASVIASLGA